MKLKKQARNKNGYKKNKKKKIVITMGCVAGVCVISGGVIASQRNKVNAMPQTGGSVQETKASVGTIANTIVGTGTLQAQTSHEVLVPAGLTFDTVNVSSGDHVAKGDVLAVVNQTSVLSRIETIQNQIVTLDAKIAEAQDEEDAIEVTAGVSGVVQEIYVAAGEDVSDSMTKHGAVMLITVTGTEQTLAVTVTGGTVETLEVAQGDTVSAGDTLLTLSASSNTNELEYQLSERARLTETLQTLMALKSDGSITAAFDGTIGDVNITGKSNGSTTSANEENLSKSANQTDVVSAANIQTQDEHTEEKTGENGNRKENTDNTDVTNNDDNNTLKQNQTTDQGTPSTDTPSTDAPGTDGKEPQNLQPTDSQNQAGGAENSGESNASNRSNMPQEIGNVGTHSTMAMASGTVGNTAKTVAVTDNTASSSGSTQSSSSQGNSNSDDTEVVAFTMSSDDDVTLAVNVDELDINSVSVDQEATITLDAIEDQTYTGIVTKVADSASSSSGGVAKYTVDITMSKDMLMKVGMNASATITVEEKEDVVTVPVSALQEKGNRTFVYTQKDEEGNLSGEQEVTTGLSDGGSVEITGGLSEGDTIYYQRKGVSSSQGASQMPGGFDKQNMSGDFQGGHDRGDMSEKGMPAGGPGGAPN